jgi:hypothetical protein
MNALRCEQLEGFLNGDNDWQSGAANEAQTVLTRFRAIAASKSGAVSRFYANSRSAELTERWQIERRNAYFNFNGICVLCSLGRKQVFRIVPRADSSPVREIEKVD